MACRVKYKLLTKALCLAPLPLLLPLSMLTPSSGLIDWAKHHSLFHQVFTLALSPPQPLPQLRPYASFGTWLSYCILQEASSDLQSRRWVPKSCGFIVAHASLSQLLSHCNLINSSLVSNRFQMLAPRTCTDHLFTLPSPMSTCGRQ